MSRILVTLLGKAVNNQNYRIAHYGFSEKITQTSRFFGLSLCNEIKPDKLVVLGTTGSMWDNLLRETTLGDDPALTEDLLRLGSDAQDDAIQQTTLNQLAERLQEVLAIECELKLIPYGRTQHEQIDTLKILVNSFNEKDTAILDVTTGLRHLPMLVQQSALLLQTLKKVHIEDIYYGAHDLTPEDPKITPVMKLSGLLEIDRWSQALRHYDKDGDYSVFIDLFSQVGMSNKSIEALSEAAFYEQTHNIAQARRQLRVFLACLKQEEAHCDEHIKLFLPALKQRFAWVEQQNQYFRQAEVAWLCFHNGKLLRATMYGLEAFITRLVLDHHGNPDHYEDREAVKFKCRKPRYAEHIYKNYYKLQDIRNQLVHGYSDYTHKKNNNISEIIANPITLQYTLGHIFTALLPVVTTHL